MIISIDDSGDPGLKLNKGSSRYFIIAAVLFEDNLDAEETALRIKRLRQGLGWQAGHEFKFRKTSPEIRKQFLTEICKCRFKVSLIILDKNNVLGNREFKNNPSNLYNLAILRSIQGFDSQIIQAHILIDGESGLDYRRNIKAFFRKNLTRDAIKQLSYHDSRDDNLIQLADMIAGATRRSVERDKDSSYLRSVKKRIVNINTSL